MCSQGPKWRQIIIWITDLGYWCIYATLDIGELNVLQNQQYIPQRLFNY